MQSNGYFFRESVTPRSVGLPPPSSATKSSGRHLTAGRGRTFTDPTHAAMGFNHPTPIPFAVEQIEEAKAAALREQKGQSQGYHRAIRGTSTSVQRERHMVETKHHQLHPSGGNRGRTFSEPIAAGREKEGGKALPKADELDSAISQDDSASLFNTSPKSFLMGQQSGGGGGGKEQTRFDYEGTS